MMDRAIDRMTTEGGKGPNESDEEKPEEEVENRYAQCGSVSGLRHTERVKRNLRENMVSNEDTVR